MSKRFKGKMIVKAAFSVGKQKTRVMTKEYEVGDDIPADVMGEQLVDMLRTVLPEVSNPTNITLVVNFA